MDYGENVHERRRFNRKEAELSAVFKLLSVHEDALSGARSAERRAAKSVNISPGGIQLLLESSQVEPETIVGLEFSLKEEKNVKTFAEVKWVRFDDRIHKYRMGLEFLAIREDDREDIKTFAGN